MTLLDQIGNLGTEVLDTVILGVDGIGDGIKNSQDAAAAKVEYIRVQTAIKSAEAKNAMEQRKLLVIVFVVILLLLAGTFTFTQIFRSLKR